jgi:hypothetical protein
MGRPSGRKHPWGGGRAIPSTDPVSLPELDAEIAATKAKLISLEERTAPINCAFP